MEKTEFLKATRWVAIVGGFICVAVYSARADQIVLSNGDVLHGRIMEQTEDHVVLEHPDLGTFKIAAKRIRTFSVTTDTASKDQARKIAGASKPLDDEIPETVWYMPEFNRLNNWATAMKEKGFKMSLNLSLDGSWGDTDEQSLRFGSVVKRETDAFRMKTDMRYYHKTKSGETTDNKLSVGYRKDWLRSDSPWFYYYQGRYDFDDFESWRHRASGHGGPGYRLVDSKRWILNLRGGPGARKEWGSDNDDVRFEGIAGLDMTLKISKRETLTGYTDYYPVLTDFDDYRTRSGFEWRYLMSRELNLSLLVGLDHEYQNIVDPGNDKNDTRAYVGIQYDF